MDKRYKYRWYDMVIECYWYDETYHILVYFNVFYTCRDFEAKSVPAVAAGAVFTFKLPDGSVKEVPDEDVYFHSHSILFRTIPYYSILVNTIPYYSNESYNIVLWETYLIYNS